MRTIRIILISLPWIIALVLGLVLWLNLKQIPDDLPEKKETTSTVILQEMISLGKLELVKYNFKEVTELRKLAPEYFYKTIKIGKDSKIAIITSGSAVGCIDLTLLSEQNIRTEADTLYINLPDPELCYHKLNMDQTRIYSLETNPLINKESFIQEAYTEAEAQIEIAALESGILGQTRNNAEIMLKPLLEKLSGKKVVFVKKLQDIRLDTPL